VKWTLYFVVIALSASAWCQQTVKVKTFLRNGELTSQDIAGARQLSEYDNGGHFDCGRCKADFRCTVPTALNSTRAFIWDHWANKKRGYIRLSGHSVDAMSTWHIFIEPDSSGAWSIVLRVVRDHDEIDDRPLIHRVEKSDEGDQNRLVFLRDNGEELLVF